MIRRVFIALAVPEDVREVVRQAQRQLSDAVPGASIRWQTPENTHLTLCFLGAVDEDELRLCRRVLGTCSARATTIGLVTTKMGAFPSPRRPSVLWLGVAGDLAKLQELHGQLAQGLAAIGKKQDDSRFVPHLTLGRVKRLASRDREALRNALQDKQLPAVEWTADHLELVESRLTPQGARYRTLARFPLR